MVVTLIHRFSLLLSVCGGGFEQEGVSVGFLGVAWEMEGGVKVNFLARCGQKSDLSGLCGIGYWVWIISTL